MVFYKLSIDGIHDDNYNSDFEQKQPNRTNIQRILHRRHSIDGHLIHTVYYILEGRLPLPICRRVFSIVEFLFTFDNKPNENLFGEVFGSVNPSTTIEVTCALKVSPTRLFNS